MTGESPLTREEQEAVNGLSSHIDVSATRAVVEYHWGDFKHNPVHVLHKFFDGFLYRANWGVPQLALRFPHGVLPADLLADYDCEEFATFTCHKDYDILDICFGELEAPDSWEGYDLGSLMPLRHELMEGDLRALYIVWLAGQVMIEGYDEGDEDEDAVPPVPPLLGCLTSAQRTLAAMSGAQRGRPGSSARQRTAPAGPGDDQCPATGGQACELCHAAYRRRGCGTGERACAAGTEAPGRRASGTCRISTTTRRRTGSR